MDGLVPLDKTSAQKEFDRICESWHVEIEEDESGSVEKILKAIQKGVLVVKNGKDESHKMIMEHYLSEPLSEGKDFLSYKFITAGDMIVMDEFKEQQTFKRMVALVSAISREAQPIIRRMTGKDLMMGAFVGGLFLAV